MNHWTHVDDLVATAASALATLTGGVSGDRNRADEAFAQARLWLARGAARLRGEDDGSEPGVEPEPADVYTKAKIGRIVALRSALVRELWKDVADEAECTCDPDDRCPLCEALAALGAPVLVPGEVLTADRLRAAENGPSSFPTRNEAEETREVLASGFRAGQAWNALRDLTAIRLRESERTAEVVLELERLAAQAPGAADVTTIHGGVLRALARRLGGDDA